MKEKTKEKIKEYLLNNMETTKDVVSQLNGWNSCLDYLEYWNNDDEFFDLFYNKPMEAVRACCYGDYNYCDDYVSIDVYGNLKSCSEWDLQDELKSNIDDIVDNLEEEIDNIDIFDDELKRIIEEDEESGGE